MEKANPLDCGTASDAFAGAGAALHCSKLTVYTAAQSTLFQLLPAARERPVASFFVTVFLRRFSWCCRGINIRAGRRRRHGARDRQIRSRLEEGPGDGRRW